MRIGAITSSWLSLAAGWCIVVAGVTSSCAAQVGVSVPSSLEQTASITSRGTQHLATAGPTALPEGFPGLLLAPGFLLELSVFRAPEMSQQLRVDAAGDVDVPLAGTIHVANDTVSAAQTKIKNALIEKQMFVNPTVTLTIVAYAQQQIVVAGEVQQPGKVPALAPLPLLDVLATAGGVTTAAGGTVEIRHPQAGGADLVQTIPYSNGHPPDPSRQAIVYPGDTVYVQRAGVIYVLGAVNRPGGYLMVNGGELTVPQAVALASGTNPVAAVRQAIVVRKNGAQIEQLPVPLKAEDRGDRAPFILKDGDMLYVPTSAAKAIFVNSSTILSSAASAGIYLAAGH